MAKKVFINGKSVRMDQLTPQQIELERLLRNEKKLTTEWYARISGAIPWASGERERMAELQDRIAMQIEHFIGKQELKAIGGPYT